MQCNCREKVTATMIEQIKTALPEGHEDFSASLDNYCLTFQKSGGLEERAYVSFSGHVMVPKARGGLKKQKINQKITVAFCPFCGTKAAAEEEG
jgi:hypothetical protein